jgi:hypothetical protein
MKTKFAALTTAILMSATGAANADNRCVGTHEIDAMRARQHARIEQGRQSGQLSWREHRVLKAEQMRIGADERFARIDGCVSPAEFRRIEQELAISSQHISRLKHNDVMAGGRDESERRWYRRWW